MDLLDFIYLIPISILLGGVALGSFIWALERNQFEDLEGDSARILFDQDDKPIAKAHNAATK